MSFELLSNSDPIARKAHKCIWCGGEIPKGEKYHRQAGRMEGAFQSNGYHEDCFLAAVTVFAELDDGFPCGVFKRGTCEEK